MSPVSPLITLSLVPRQTNDDLWRAGVRIFRPFVSDAVIQLTTYQGSTGDTTVAAVNDVRLRLDTGADISMLNQQLLDRVNVMPEQCEAVDFADIGMRCLSLTIDSPQLGISAFHIFAVIRSFGSNYPTVMLGLHDIAKAFCITTMDWDAKKWRVQPR